MNAILMTATSTADVSTFLELGTSVVTWLLTQFGAILTFMLANPICFLGLIMTIVGTAFVYLRSTIGG